MIVTPDGCILTLEELRSLRATLWHLKNWEITLRINAEMEKIPNREIDNLVNMIVHLTSQER